MTARLAPAAAAAVVIVGAGAATVAAAALGQGAAAREPPFVLGVWLPADRAVPDPLPLTDAARAALRATALAEAERAAVERGAAEPGAAEPGEAEPAASDPAAPGATTAGRTTTCAPGMPALLDTHDAVAITQDGDRIRMSYAEWSGTARTIYMNPRNGPPTQEPSPLGVSFGRWEARTLAIFTTYIAYPYFDRAGTPQSVAVTVLERYAPSADGTRLEWKVTVTDAATFTAPVVMAGAMTLRTAAAGARDGAVDGVASSAAPPVPLVAGACVG